jgi:hypothetical protein
MVVVVVVVVVVVATDNKVLINITIIIKASKILW